MQVARLAPTVLFATLLVAPLAAQTGATAASRTLVNTDRSGLALQGYDPVAFFIQNRPVEGSAGFTSVVNGATYRFSSAEHKALFDQDPARYEPAFGGYCAYGVSQGGLFPVEVETFQILQGRLVLNKNMKVKEAFDRERQKRYDEAVARWPGLVEKKGTP